MKLTHLQPNIIKICNNNEANFPHNLLLTDKQVSSIRKAFAFNSSVNIKLFKNSTIYDNKSGRFLDKLRTIRINYSTISSTNKN